MIDKATTITATIATTLGEPLNETLENIFSKLREILSKSVLWIGLMFHLHSKDASRFFVEKSTLKR